MFVHNPLLSRRIAASLLQPVVFLLVYGCVLPTLRPSLILSLVNTCTSASIICRYCLWGDKFRNSKSLLRCLNKTNGSGSGGAAQEFKKGSTEAGSGRLTVIFSDGARTARRLRPASSQLATTVCSNNFSQHRPGTLFRASSQIRDAFWSEVTTQGRQTLRNVVSWTLFWFDGFLNDR